MDKSSAHPLCGMTIAIGSLHVRRHQEAYCRRSNMRRVKPGVVALLLALMVLTMLLTLSGCLFGWRGDGDRHDDHHEGDHHDEGHGDR
jgi:hypothetical protein